MPLSIGWLKQNSPVIGVWHPAPAASAVLLYLALHSQECRWRRVPCPWEMTSGQPTYLWSTFQLWKQWLLFAYWICNQTIWHRIVFSEQEAAKQQGVRSCTVVTGSADHSDSASAAKCVWHIFLGRQDTAGVVLNITFSKLWEIHRLSFRRLNFFGLVC